MKLFVIDNSCTQQLSEPELVHLGRLVFCGPSNRRALANSRQIVSRLGSSVFQAVVQGLQFEAELLRELQDRSRFIKHNQRL